MMDLLQNQKLINGSVLKIIFFTELLPKKICYDHADESERNNKNLQYQVWIYYTKATLKSSFGVTRGTFTYILDVSSLYLQRETLAEDPISPDERLASFLHKMGRGDYIHTVAELFGVGDSTVCNIVLEVPKLKIEVTWDVAVHFPTTERDYINLMN